MNVDTDPARPSPGFELFCTGFSTLDTQHPDSRFAQAIELFNQQEFFACHDLLEELWSEILNEDREFLQGLIHAAVALFHFGEGNLGGARKMHDSAINYLNPFLPVRRGVDLERFLREFDQCFTPILGTQSGYPHHAQLDEAMIPRIHWSPGCDKPS